MNQFRIFFADTTTETSFCNLFYPNPPCMLFHAVNKGMYSHRETKGHIFSRSWSQEKLLRNNEAMLPMVSFAQDTRAWVLHFNLFIWRVIYCWSKKIWLDQIVLTWLSNTYPTQVNVICVILGLYLKSSSKQGQPEGLYELEKNHQSRSNFNSSALRRMVHDIWKYICIIFSTVSLFVLDRVEISTTKKYLWSQCFLGI